MSDRSRLGFSLLEMTLVLLVLSVLLTGLLTPLVSARESHRHASQRVQWQHVEQALVGHLLARGRLPCAATADSGGHEVASATGCGAYAGFVPVATLGVNGTVDRHGRLLDAWHRPVRYRLSASDSDGDGRADYAVTDGMVLQTPRLVRADNRIVHAVDADCGSTAARADGIVVVLVSEGSGTARSAAERENLDGDSRFVSRAVSEVAACAFDDPVHWLTENRVLTLLLTAGVLPRSD
ncbi:MAG: prepilin-type N-terminal cleavage/methylation domain-containing protein [Pseudomonadota bacterium]